MLINGTADADGLNIASPEDVDLAMIFGANYPHGLLAWADALGLETVLARIVKLFEAYGEERYRPSPLLKRMVAEKRNFYSS